MLGTSLPSFDFRLFFLQHMCVAAVASRAEVRGHCAEIIVALRALLPHSLRRAFLRFLVKFGRSAKIPNRTLAVEIAARLLGAATGSAGGSTGIASLPGSGGRGPSRSSGDEAALSALMHELRSPSAGDARFEAEGYGSEAIDYAGEIGDMTLNGDGSVASWAVSSALRSRLHAGSPEGAVEGDAAAPGSVAGSAARMARRRASICALGFEGATTPARAQLARSASGVTPFASSGGAATPSKAAKSPFYGRRVDGAGSGDGGCVDPRPSALLLLDYVLHRVSDKSPAVRARALTAMDALMNPSHVFAAANAALLGHAAAALAFSVAAANAAAPAAERTDESLAGDVSLPLADLTMAWLRGADDSICRDSVVEAAAQTPGPRADAVTDGVYVRSTPGPHPLVPLLVRRLQVL